MKNVDECPLIVPFFRICPICGGVDDNLMLHSLEVYNAKTPDGTVKFYKCHACGSTISREEYVTNNKKAKEEACC